MSLTQNSNLIRTITEDNAGDYEDAASVALFFLDKTNTQAGNRFITDTAHNAKTIIRQHAQGKKLKIIRNRAPILVTTESPSGANQSNHYHLYNSVDQPISMETFMCFHLESSATQTSKIFTMMAKCLLNLRKVEEKSTLPPSTVI